MQVTNTQTTNPGQQVPGRNQTAGFDVQQRVTEQANQAGEQTKRHGQVTAAIDNIAATMSAHGATPILQNLAQKALIDATRPMLENPGIHFEANLEILSAHIVHGLLARAGVIDDPNIPQTGPINIPQHRDDGTLEIVLIALPDVPEEAPVPTRDDFQRSTSADNYRMTRTERIRGTMEFTHGAPHLSAAASRTFFEAAREIVQDPHEFTKENMNILQAHIIHHLLARDGIIDDPNAPTEGPIFVPQYLADGTMHHVPVELLMEPLPRHEA